MFVSVSIVFSGPTDEACHAPTVPSDRRCRVRLLGSILERATSGVLAGTIRIGDDVVCRVRVHKPFRRLTWDATRTVAVICDLLIDRVVVLNAATVPTMLL